MAVQSIPYGMTVDICSWRRGCPALPCPALPDPAGARQPPADPEASFDGLAAPLLQNNAFVYAQQRSIHKSTVTLFCVA